MTQRFSIRDVAKKAGVSISSVSLAYHKPYQLSEKTRNTILTVAEEMGYKPNQNKLSNSISVIALMIPNYIDCSVFNQIFILKVSQVLANHGYQLMITYYHSIDNLDQKVKSVESCNMVRGIFVILHESKKTMKIPFIPTVFLSSICKNHNYINIGYDVFKDIIVSINHLYNQGKQSIGVIMFDKIYHNEEFKRQLQVLSELYPDLLSRCQFCLFSKNVNDMDNIIRFYQQEHPESWIIIGTYALYYFNMLGIKDQSGYIIIEDISLISYTEILKNFTILEFPICEIINNAFENFQELLVSQKNQLSSKTIICSKKITN
ncbi:MAG: LacI family DNA-binding transcriptional regulator [Brevinemataceae bacterium]